jgi:hypothetical protein
VILRQYEFVCFFVPSALCLFLPRLFGVEEGWCAGDHFAKREAVI